MQALPQAQFTGQFFSYRSPELCKEVVCEYIGKDAAGSTFFQLHIDENTVVEKVFADWEMKLGQVRSRFTALNPAPKAQVTTPENVTKLIETQAQKFRVKVRQFMTRRDANPVPMREMMATVKRETGRAVLVTMKGFIAPSSHCLHCGRALTHPVSLLYGIGPICGGHFHINPLNSEEELQARYAEMCQQMENVTWEGWIPRSAIESMQVSV